MITCSIEPFEKAMVDIYPLSLDHSAEVDKYMDKLEVNADLERFLQVESLGSLVTVAARDDDGEMVGYMAVFVTPHLHYKDHLFASTDLLYVVPKHRKDGVASKMIALMEDHLKTLGVSVFAVAMKEDHRFESLMKSVGFDKAEIIYSKYIGED